MIKKELLKEYAGKLMFDMNEEEYVTLQNEFEVILKQVELIDQIDGVKEVKPMSFPFVTYDAKLREDKINQTIAVEDVLANADRSASDQVKVPKVVE